VARIKGAADYASGEVADCATVGVKAVDDLTLEITLEAAASFFPKLLAFRTFLPARLDLVGTPGSPGLAAEQPVTNGPYTLVEWQPGERIVLAQSPTYWNASQVAIRQIEFRVVPTLADQLALYEAGDLQVADFPAEETPRIQADPAFNRELHVLVRPGVSYIGLNTRSGPTQDVNFRRAIASAIDREHLIRDVLKQPWHVPAQTVIPPGILGYQGEDPAVGYPYDPEKASAYLTEAGYGPDKPVSPVELWFNREGHNEIIFKAVAGMLEQVGIPVRLVTSQWSVYLGSLDACNKPNRADATRTPAECSYNLYRMGWVMDYADPAGILDVVFSPKSAFQYTGWQAGEYEALLGQALAEPAEDRRADLYRRAERILLNEAVVVVPLMYYDRTVLIKDGIMFDYPPFGAPNLQYWRLP
jgi:ABC-type oligopeptide transport system substrate-binding subunit